MPSAPKVRIATPSDGMSSCDLIVYTADATEFGADKTGKVDSTPAIQSALDMCDKAEGGTVFLPAGRYRVEGRLEIRGGTSLRGEWVSPDAGGLGNGTILMAYAGRGEEKPDSNAFIRLHSGGCLRDLGVWYPEQKASAPVAYPATIHGSGHTTMCNITLYNNADVWSGSSRIADVHGGKVTFLQLLSWCCFGTQCESGGELNVLASTYVSDHIGMNA